MRDKIQALPDGTFVQYGNSYLPIKPETGYWVGAGVYSVEEIELDGITIFGLWTDQWTNDKFIDRVVYLEDLEEAMELGRHHKELAIWDIANNKEIRL